MNKNALCIAAIAFLFAYGLVSSFFLWRMERKLESGRQETISLSVALNVAKNENEKAQNEISRQNARISGYAAEMAQAETEYRAELERLAAEKPAIVEVVKKELIRDSGAENQLRLIADILQDYMTPRGEQ